ncbi:hypothetical protein D3C80_901650 [compost metagenome]
MNRVKGPLATCPLVDWMPLSKLPNEPAMLNLRALIIALLVAVAGCASKERPPEPPPTPVVISQSTWRQIDSDIVAASKDATGEAKDYSRELMQRWRTLVYQRTEAEFIPWFSSYWTRQWLTMKVTWYQLNAEGAKYPAVDRLALYLQEQYQDRVLEPVAKEIRPDWIMAQTTQLYVRLLREQLQGIPPRYGVPLDQFDNRLQDIPAIELEPGASLYQLVTAEPIDSQPAYAALVTRLHNIPGAAGTWSAQAGITPVARMTSESLVTERTTRGVAGAVSAMVGRAAGLVISLGTAAFTAMLRENERPKMEAQLRNNLHAAFDEEWLDLVHNPKTGVMAGVYALSEQIEGSLASTVMQPARYEPPAQEQPLQEPPPQVVPPPDGQPMQRQQGNSDDEDSYQLW